jgi:hypothetical protein
VFLFPSDPNVKKLTFQLEKKNAKHIWAISKNFQAEDDAVPDISAAFLSAMVTGERHSASRMGIQLWLSSGPGIAARAGFCRDQSRCHITNNKNQQQSGSIPKCDSCNAGKWGSTLSF